MPPFLYNRGESFSVGRTSILTRDLNSTYNMDDVTHHHGERRRLHWTPKMCVDLLQCRDMARQLHSSEDCPRKVNGRRQGVMELTKRFWDEKGYQNLERTAQNLRDKIGHLEKSSQIAAVLIDNEIDEQLLQLINAEEQSEQHTVISNNNEAQPDINTEQSNDAHIPESEYITNVTPQSTSVENTQQPLHSNIAPEWENLRQKAFVIYTNVKEELGNWKTRKDNTFTKVVSNKTEIKHLERIAVSLVKEDPANKPENYLWECNCTIYSVAMAWKRKDQRNSNDNRHTSNNSQSNFKHRRKPKEVKKIEENMQLCRRELSQLTAEIERIRSNRPLSRKQSATDDGWKKKVVKRT